MAYKTLLGGQIFTFDSVKVRGYSGRSGCLIRFGEDCRKGSAFKHAVEGFERKSGSSL